MGLPDLGFGACLLEALLQVGPTVLSAMGEEPLSWPVVWAYAQATEAVCEPWELRLLIDMIHGYMDARQQGEDPLARAPADQEGG